eukprot:1367370-Amphidinium_carterae.1
MSRTSFASMFSASQSAMHELLTTPNSTPKHILQSTPGSHGAVPFSRKDSQSHGKPTWAKGTCVLTLCKPWRCESLGRAV